MVQLTDRLSRWKRDGHWFEYRGHEIFYRTEGSGAPLLLIHGFPTASWDWIAVWPRLKEHFRLVACDMIGFGFSAKPKQYSYSIHDQADLHLALCAELGIREAHVLAHDYGDTVAQELLARFNEDVSQSPKLHSVCLLNGGLFPESHRPRLIQKLLASPIGPVVGRLMNRRGFGRSFSSIFGSETQPSSTELDEFWSLIETNHGQAVMHKLIGYMEERRRFRERWVGALVNAKIPLRHINGVDDPISGGHVADRYVELVPHPDVVRLEKVGHYPQVEAPERVCDALMDFWKM